ncbi:MAG: DUF4350 domain-containing protein [Pseudomonadota bacterium]|nr:DUF4350 domain-containing protein [Pseudomonadota bacterium]
MGFDRRLLTLTLVGLSVILSVQAVAWFLRNFESRTQEVDTGYAFAARRNPFLAAEQFLHRLGVPVESIAGRDRLRNLPPAGDVLVVNGLGALNAKRREALYAWLRRGGRLIVEAAHFSEDAERLDPRDFLARFGVRLGELSDSEAASLVDDEVVTEVRVDNYPDPLKVGFLARYYLEDTAEEGDEAVAAGAHSRMLRYRVGKGRLTVTSDNLFMTNADIGNQDHALFLYLLTGPSDGGKVWLLYDSAMPWLGALLWQKAPYAVASVLCLVGFFLWHLGGRLGPLLPKPEKGRRDLSAHLLASAEFLLRHGRGSQLATVARRRVEQAWLRRHRSLRDMEPGERAAWIARHQGLPASAVERALYPQTENDADLVARAALLQRLWSALSVRGRGTR